MQNFDYVVIGAGTAGCVVAARLSEERGASVLLLEAGGSDRTLWIQVPIGLTSGNTNAPTVMVAEKGAYLVRQERK